MTSIDTHADGTVASRVTELTAVFERGLRENLGVGASLGIRRFDHDPRVPPELHGPE